MGWRRAKHPSPEGRAERGGMDGQEGGSGGGRSPPPPPEKNTGAT